MAQSENRPAVLIVDDEPLLRIAAADHIADLGYIVLEAGNRPIRRQKAGAGTSEP